MRSALRSQALPEPAINFSTILAQKFQKRVEKIIPPTVRRGTTENPANPAKYPPNRSKNAPTPVPARRQNLRHSRHVEYSPQMMATGIPRASGEIGRHDGLKIRFPKGSAGSIPASPTI